MVKLAQSAAILLGIAVILQACSPKQRVIKGSVALSKDLAISYELASNPNQDLNKVALIIPSSWDSMAVFKQQWSRPLWKEGYDILVVNQLKGGDFYRRRSQEYYGKRLGQVLKAWRDLKNEATISGEDGLILITAGESCYLAAELGRHLKPDHTFLINGLPFGPLAHLKNLQKKDSLNDTTQKWLRDWGIDSMEQLPATLKKVQQGNPDDFTLGNHSNKYWISYGQTNFIRDYNYLPGNVDWILFKDYPLLQTGDVKYIKKLEAVRSGENPAIEVFPGTGLYRDETTREALEKYFKNISRGGLLP